MENIYLIDSNNNRYDFPPDFWLRDDGWNISSSVKKLAYGAGGRNTSDSFPEARNISVKGALRADSLTELETKLRALSKAVINGGKLYVTDDTVSRYITVSNAKVDSDYIGDYRFEKPVNINFLCQYPFWEDNLETEAVMIGDSITIDNSDSDFIVLPVIQIEADQGNDIPSITLTNTSDGNLAFMYNDPAFVSGDTLIIDCKNGTVKKNSTNTIEYFSPPAFLRLLPSTNVIDYTGANCTLTIKYRKIYL